MAIKASTGLRNGVMTTGSLKSLLDGKVLKIFSGPEPLTADAALAGNTRLTSVSNNATATGITFEPAAINGVAFKTATEIWRGVNAATGSASFYRIEDAADAGGASTTAVRLQGGVGVAGSDLNLSSIALTSGASQNVDFYTVELPTL